MKSFISARNELREIYQYQNNNYPEWYTGPPIPSRIIDGAIQTCIKNYDNNIKKVQSKTITHFKMHYKTKKDTLQSIVLFADTFPKKQNTFNMKYLGKTMRSVIPFKGKIKKDSRLQYNYILDVFELVIPYDKVYNKKTPFNGVIALDPGSRTLLTGYSPAFHTVEIGKNISDVTRKMNKTDDMIRSKRDKCKNKKKKKMYTKVLARHSNKKKNMRDELHWKTCKFLTDNYETVILGNMSTKSIISKKNNLNKKSKRDFSFSSLFLLKQRLEYKCKSHDIQFIFQNEAYTTKTCTRCGDKHSHIGSNKLFQCPTCNISIDRDENAARNIYMRANIETLSKQTMSVTSSI